MREKRLCGEAGKVSTTTLQAWTDQLPELFQDCEPQNILNLDELGLFFNALPEKGLMEKRKKTKGGKKSKQCMNVMFIVAFDGSFVFEPTVIWRSKRPCCFKSFKDPLRTMYVHYCSNKKLGWTQTLWRVFCRDLTEKCAWKSARLFYLGQSYLPF